MQRHIWSQLGLHHQCERGAVEVDGEVVGYTLCEVGEAHDGPRAPGPGHGASGGNLNVYVPGHGQSAVAASSLLAAIVILSRSQVVWAIDVDPPRGGDPARAAALVKIVRQKAGQVFGHCDRVSEKAPQVTMFGWSHGAIEAMLAAERAPDLIPRVVCLCPAGLVEHAPAELVARFVKECLCICWNSLLRSHWTISRIVAVGCNLLLGIVRDSLRCRSLRRAIHDVRWGAQKVVGEDYSYDGTVVLVFGTDDGVIRWRDVFPACQDPGDVGRSLEEYRKHNFPMVRGLGVQILDGSHMAPEVDSAVYVKTALDLLDRDQVRPYGPHLRVQETHQRAHPRKPRGYARCLSG